MHKPLKNWNFKGELRKSQSIIIAETAYQLGTADPLHIVAPPGAGKTLLGLVLAAEQGDKTLALAPTTTVRTQWASTAEMMLPVGTPTDCISEDPKRLGDLTLLTYQMLSVLDRGSPFKKVAHDQWVKELQEAGRSAENARTWLTSLAETNKKAYQAGILRRSRNIRKNLTKQDPEVLEEALHPNARNLIARIADHGVTTIILDECHHLLDHWALVIRTLINRIEAKGETVTLIGLTATLPSLDDKEEYENYTGLLGEVDYELPTPAVVKEGNLAPYRNFAWFVNPTKEEVQFLKKQEEELINLVGGTLATADGIDFLCRLVSPQPDVNTDNKTDKTTVNKEAWRPPETRREADHRFEAAFAKDYVLIESVAKFLWQVDPQNLIAQNLPAELKTAPSVEQSMRTIARYALERILPNENRAKEWEQTRRVLADYGFFLTDKGVRKGRDPVDAILATTVAKERAIGEILRIEMSRENSTDIRAVAVCDFAVHGHSRGKGTLNAGALRTFNTVVADPSLNDLRPVLVTAKHLRVATRDADYLIPKLQAIFAASSGTEKSGTEITVTKETLTEFGVTELKFAGIGPAKIVRAISELMTAGVVRLIVGTRGLLGEGWDCPTLNTLIDLTTAGTSTSMQQLHGRTLRKDPTWGEKVAHNWLVVCAIGSESKIAATSDISRMSRKLSHVWGLSLESPGTIVKGLQHTLNFDQFVQLNKIIDVKTKAGIGKINDITIKHFPSRKQTFAEWKIGEPYASVMHEEVSIAKPARARSFSTSFTLQALLAILFGFLGSLYIFSLDVAVRSLEFGLTGMVVTGTVLFLILLLIFRKDFMAMVRGFKRFALPQRDYQGVTLAVADGLLGRGLTEPIAKENVLVEPVRSLVNGKVSRYVVTVNGVSQADQKLILDSLAEVFSSIKSPRFLLEVPLASFKMGGLFTWILTPILKTAGVKSRFFSVPALIAKRKSDAESFAETWNLFVGKCKLHEIKTPEDLVLLAEARRQTEQDEQDPNTGKVQSYRREVWS